MYCGRDVLPIGAQTVSIELPPGKSAAAARLVVTGRDLPVRIASGRVEIEVPGIERLEVLTVEWR